MLIECTIKRDKGTQVILGSTKYHFKPTDPADEDSPHICEVADAKHAERLLTIKEAYRASGKVDASVEKALKKKQAEDDELKKAQAKNDPATTGIIPVSEETQIELVEQVVSLMERYAKAKGKEVESADDLQVKDVTKLLKDFAAINVNNKDVIIQYGKGCDVELDKNDAPGRMIKDLFNALLDRHTTKEPEGEQSGLGSDADTDEHAEGLTDQGGEDGADDEGTEDGDDDGGDA